MEKFNFFNDIDGDRVYFAEDFARHLAKYFTNGIFNNELRVVANNDMSVTIEAGDANIEGYRYTNTAELQKTIDNADGTLNRIDNVVLRLDLTNRLISAQIIKGTFAEEPTAPPLVRSSTVYDLRIAKISVPAGTTEITQDLITDTRFISNDCGNVTQAVLSLDTTDIFNQYHTMFEEWFQNLENQLDKNQAGHLQNQIGNLNQLKSNNKTNLVNAINSNIDNFIDFLGLDVFTWSAEGMYEKGDIVYDNFKLYENLTGSNSTTEPAEDITNWRFIPMFIEDD